MAQCKWFRDGQCTTYITRTGHYQPCQGYTPACAGKMLELLDVQLLRLTAQSPQLRLWPEEPAA